MWLRFITEKNVWNCENVSNMKYGIIVDYDFMHMCSPNRLQTLVLKHNLIIASYDIVRNDIEFFRYYNYYLLLLCVCMYISIGNEP